MAVKRNYVEVCTLLENLITLQGTEKVLDELSRVMNTDDLASALEDVADNWDIEVNEDGSVEW